jgi:hypothetical protein
MAETNLKQIAQSVIPDDPEASAYRFIIVAAKRARQLQSVARSFLPTKFHPATAYFFRHKPVNTGASTISAIRVYSLE